MCDLLCGTKPIQCAHLLRTVDFELVQLLRGLESAEWDLPTIAGAWRARDVAAHLLDTALRKLSLARDGCVVEQVEIHSSADLADLVNRLNREGVTVYRRLSPPVLIGLLELTAAASADWHEALDPFATAAFGVSWAGEMQSANWFDTARELTERWHHQQQIRLATHRPGLFTPELYHPVLDCFLRGLPFAFRNAQARAGTSVAVTVAGAAGGRWVLTRREDDWAFTEAEPTSAASHVTIPEVLAWRIFTRGATPEEIRTSVRIDGDQALGSRVLGLTAIVA
ncbi:MAG: maleylpyruvate isomerase N-terminal domain-containing protein [Terracidiphilus sp.]|nr:maleylpyruvate isomerase N-terminal domain-containing protein [Terracidiphilus sp.]